MDRDGTVRLLTATAWAVIAFELARELRRRDLLARQVLVASGARAPQLSAGSTPPPEPTDAELLEQLALLEGVPAELLADRASLDLALRGDLRLYRNYPWSAEAPLAMPIVAYADPDDPNVRPDQVAASLCFRDHCSN